MKKVVFITNYFPKLPHLTSFGTWAFDQAKAISKNNDTLVITFTPYIPKYLKKLSSKFNKWADVYKTYVENENLKIVYVRVNPFLFKNMKKYKKNPFFWSKYFYIKIKNEIKIFSPDLLIANHVLLEGAITNLLSKKFKLPYICFEHSPDDFLPVNKKHFYGYKKVIEESKNLVSVSEYSFTQVNKIYNFPVSKNFTLYNYSQDAKNLKDEKIFEKYRFFDRTKKYLIEVANFENRKNHLLVLKMFNDLKNIYPDFNLVFVGSHDQTLGFIHKYIEENDLANRVTVLCDMKHSDVLNLLNFMNIFILPSNSEMFSVSALEAISAELPLIVTKYNGLTDRIFEKSSIINVDPEDETGIKTKLEELMGDLILCKKIGAENRKLYEKYFTKEHYEKNINELIKRIK